MPLRRLSDIIVDEPLETPLSKEVKTDTTVETMNESRDISSRKEDIRSSADADK